MIDISQLGDSKERKALRDSKVALIASKESTIRIWREDPSTRKEIVRLETAIEVLQVELQKRKDTRDHLQDRIASLQAEILKAKKDIVTIDTFTPKADVTQAVKDAAKHLTLQQLLLIQERVLSEKTER